MTLKKVVIKIAGSADEPGVLFTCLTRIRHPDTLMLDDNFPSYGNIMRVKKKETFVMRQRWERKIRARFSRTIRRHMRDRQQYSKDRVWTETDSALADAMLAALARKSDTPLPDFPAHFLTTSPDADPSAVHRVWARLQTFPTASKSLKISMASTH